MMHDREKSDPSIVAKKPTNNDGPPPKPWRRVPSAELVERRGGAEGNAFQPSTLRTPSRDGVTEGLERIRTAAKQRKKERFTALLHHVSVDLLRSAYSWLKRDAAAGVDGVTWEEYGNDLDRRLADLHSRVHRGSYRAQPSQRRYIPNSVDLSRSTERLAVPLSCSAFAQVSVNPGTALVVSPMAPAGVRSKNFANPPNPLAASPPLFTVPCVLYREEDLNVLRQESPALGTCDPPPGRARDSSLRAQLLGARQSVSFMALAASSWQAQRSSAFARCAPWRVGGSRRGARPSREARG